MTNTTNEFAKTNGSTEPNGSTKTRPSFRAWLVQDTPEGEARRTELSGLWPTKSGAGFKGGLRTPVSATTGRIAAPAISTGTSIFRASATQDPAVSEKDS